MNKYSTILITGSTGFVGSNLIKELRQQGYNNIIPCSNTKETLNVYKCDLENKEATQELFNKFGPDIVFHLAAKCGGIGANRLNPGEFFYSNLVMGVNVVEACRLKGVEKLINLSTVCSYPKITEIPFKEENLFNGEPEETNSYYSHAKRAIQKMIESYRLQYGLNGITLLPSNMYGINESNLDVIKSHVIPALILKILEAKKNKLPKIEVWGSGRATREFLYVDDAVKGIILAAEKYNGFAPINLGTGVEYSIKQLIEEICNILYYKGNIVYDISKPDGQPRRCLNIEKAYNEFGFRATTSLYDGLTKTIKWFQEKYNEN
jgi:GDP-L-fucose synthase